MRKLAVLLIIAIVFLIVGCEKPKNIILKPEDFEIKNAIWDAEIEFDCEKCDKPVCKWDMGWELTYQFSPRNGNEEALCWYFVDDKVKIRPLLEKNKMILGTGKLFDPDLLLNCWEDHKVGLCCAYTQEELLNDKYACKEVLLKALCQSEW